MPVVFLILDAFPNDHVDPEVTPTLWRMAAEGGRCVDGGTAVLPSNTYPNHASFATGAGPDAHGIIGNYVWTGDEFVHSSAVGPAIATVFDAARAGGRSTAIVAGDQEIVKTMAGERADTHWPPDGELPADTPRDAFGYAADAAVLDAIDATRALDADLAVIHFNEPDTTLHLHGPTSAEAREQFRRSDASVAAVLDRLADRWDDTVICIVSDHTQAHIDPTDEIDIKASFDEAGFGGECRPEGAAALVIDGPPLADLATLDRVASVQALSDSVSLLFAESGAIFGRSFGLNGQHGCPNTAVQVAIVCGGHPAVPELASALERRRPDATDWAPTLLALLGLSPTETLPTATGTSLL